jgi:hypothetical protein
MPTAAVSHTVAGGRQPTNRISADEDDTPADKANTRNDLRRDTGWVEDDLPAH